ncbi:PAS domain-containing protein [Methylohalomonas lacus]|uniref:PAS domain-containing protein n=1 Tax=Methylohalomonas lacus TaxID=398773 RepID=A0AAE3HM15_9GAMM|nr:PAS domain-containing protein [Methylohalomonas lacus]MCS3902942.1 PAS domain-containing protein [Methylohalomonas lacus]
MRKESKQTAKILYFPNTTSNKKSQACGGVWEWDVQLNLITASAGAFDIFGLEYRKDGYRMYQLLKRIHADDRAYVDKHIKDLTLCKKKETTIKYRVVLPDGTTRVVKTYGKGCYSEEEVLTHIFGISEVVATK